MMKKVEKHWLVLVKYCLRVSGLVRYFIEPFQTNSNNQYWKGNKQVLKILLVLTLNELGPPKTN